MSLLIAILLGFIQGVTEFLPVSSSGHLILAGGLVNLDNHFTLDVLLNIGTLSALIWCFRDRIKEVLSLIRHGKYDIPIKLMVATIPAAVVGVTFSHNLADLNTSILVVIVMLAVVGLPMLFIGEKQSGVESLEKLTWWMVIGVGLAQVLALIPGTSRAAITILAGLSLGMKRTLAAEWSFLLAIPIVAAAIAKVLFSPAGLEFISQNFVAAFVGNVVSFTVGILAINYLLNLLRRRSLRPFGVYRLSLAALLLILASTHIL